MPLKVPPPSGKDPLLSASTPVTPAMLIPGPAANFPGLGQGFPGFSLVYAPPDTNMAVGPNHIVQIANASFVVFSKTGTTVLAPRTIQTLWSGFGGDCQATNDGDPIVQYDKLADRWVISQFSLGSPRWTSPFYECVAVSTSGDPTGSYTRYAFPYASNFPDYPKMGVWPDGYYFSYNMFTGSSPHGFVGAQVCALDRASMIAGSAATQQCFSTGWDSLLPSDLDGSTPPPAGSPNYLVNLGGNSLIVWKFHVDWTTPANSTFTGPTSIPVAAYYPACGGGTCMPQLGTSQKLDSLADRLMYRLAYRNFGDHESLVVNHSVATNGTNGSGVRWYELRVSSGTPSLFQQGTYAPDASFRWMGSIAMDAVGNMAIGFSLSDAASNPAIHYTGRLSGDPAGQMPQGEGTIINGTGSQTSSLSRWGDYSALRIDPSDDCTFWYTTEYLANNGTFNWHTQIASFKLPSCGLSATHFNISIPATATAGVPFTGTVTAQDASNTTVTSYTGTVHFTAGGSCSVPVDYTFLPGDNGVHTFNNGFTLNTAGNEMVTATDTVTSSITGNAAITVNAAAAKSFAWNVPPTATVGTPFSATLTVRDAFNNIAASYTGSVQLSTSGPPPTDTLPASNPYTFTSGAGGDNGVHAFANGFDVTSGTQGSTFTITGNDAANAITATSPAITVTTDAFITPQGRSIRMFRPNIPVVVATFTDNDVTETGTNLTATIDWGDGSAVDTGCSLTSTNCKLIQISANPNTFAVVGTHAYAKKASCAVKVDLTDSGGSKSHADSTARFFPINSSR